MKQLLIFVVILMGCVCGMRAETVDTDTSAMVFSNSEVAQSMPTVAFNYKKTREWRTYTALRAVGWTMFGIGTPALIGGAFVYVVTTALSNAEGGGGHDGIPLEGVIMIAGGATVIASIPILVCAYRYRDKAKRMAVSMSSISMPSCNGYGRTFAPALRVALTF